jgi:RNA polymerase sigma factor for flagellar operon FliA
MIFDHISLVKKIARHIFLKLPNHVCIDDLVQAGMVGLMEAAKNYKQDKGALFSTYAAIRIRGSIIDEMRKGDWAPRSVHRNARKIAKGIMELQTTKGHIVTKKELAEHLDLSVDNLNHIMMDTQNIKIISFEEVLVIEDLFQKQTQSKEKNPEYEAQHAEEKNNLFKMIQKMPERDRLIINLYYREELNLKQIGKILEISESRVSQILSQAIDYLKHQWNIFVTLTPAFRDRDIY